VNEQANGKHLNIEQFVSRGARGELISIDVDVLSLVRAITHNVTLIKDIKTNTRPGVFSILAAFGLPESDRWLATLIAEEE
jgi:hypothetical protein